MDARGVWVIAFSVLACWCTSAFADVGSLVGVAFAKDEPHAKAGGIIAGSGKALPRANQTVSKVWFYARCPRTNQISEIQAKVTGENWSAKLQLVPGEYECWVEMVVDVKGEKAQQKYAAPKVKLTLP